MRRWLDAAEGTEPQHRRRPAGDIKSVPYAAHLTKALETDARRPKRGRRIALKLFGELAPGPGTEYTLKQQRGTLDHTGPIRDQHPVRDETMPRLFDFKESPLVPEAAKHLSGLFEGGVTEAEVSRNRQRLKLASNNNRPVTFTKTQPIENRQMISTKIGTKQLVEEYFQIDIRRIARTAEIN